MLTPEERTRLSRIAARLRAATPGLVFSVEEDEFQDEETGDWDSHVYGVVKTNQGRIITSVGKDHLADGEVFALARSDEAFLLQLIRRMLDANQLGDQDRKTG